MSFERAPANHNKAKHGGRQRNFSQGRAEEGNEFSASTGQRKATKFEKEPGNEIRHFKNFLQQETGNIKNKKTNFVALLLL